MGCRARKSASAPPLQWPWNVEHERTHTYIQSTCFTALDPDFKNSERTAESHLKHLVFVFFLAMSSDAMAEMTQFMESVDPYEDAEYDLCS